MSKHMPHPSRFALAVDKALDRAGRAANGLPHGSLTEARAALGAEVEAVEDLIRRASDVLEGLDPSDFGGSMQVRIAKLNTAIAKALGHEA
jgi:hypothetical protein